MVVVVAIVLTVSFADVVFKAAFVSAAFGLLFFPVVFAFGAGVVFIRRYRALASCLVAAGCVTVYLFGRGPSHRPDFGRNRDIARKMEAAMWNIKWHWSI